MLAAFIVFVLITRTASQPCQYENSVQLTDRSYNGVKYQDGEYYVENITNIERGCVCMKKTCFRKCCPPGQAYNSSLKNCVPEPQKFHLPVYNNNKNMQRIQGFNATENFHFLYGRMKCSSARNERRGKAKLTMILRVMEDGKLYVENPSSIPNVFIYGPDKYCIDTFVSDHDELHLNALICFVEERDRNIYSLSSTCMLISCFFILLTLAVYAFVPELRNLHGMVLMAYLLCLFVGFLFLATMQIVLLQEPITQDVCTVLTFIVYFSLLSAFFWLNVMCYDIWWTFCGKRAPCLETLNARHSGSPKKRFMYYAKYAFGVPTALTIILGALEFSDLPIQHPLLPNIRLQGCFLNGNSKLLYLYGPIVLLWVLNVPFYVLTVFKISKNKKETKMLRGKESSTHGQDRKAIQRFIIHFKLFIVMGITWILEVVSFFFPDAVVVWRCFDAYNALVGFIVFFIFVCKKNTWTLIKERIEDFQRTNSNSREKDINNDSNKKISRWKTNQDRTASIETVKTTVGVEVDPTTQRDYNE